MNDAMTGTDPVVTRDGRSGIRPRHDSPTHRPAGEEPAGEGPVGDRPVGCLTVLHDPGCPMCRAFAGWLSRQPTLVPIELVTAGSEQVRARWPDLDHAHTLREVTVVADTGAVWHGGAAWVMCLWATVEHRPLAVSLSTPAGMVVARQVALAASGLRGLLTSTRADGEESHEQPAYADCRDGTCEI